MIGGSVARLRARFADQFTSADQGWLYRRGGRGPALPVGEADRAALVAGFDRASGWLAWGGIAASMAMWATLDWYGLHVDRWVFVAGFLLAWGGVFWFCWNAPNRLLDGRAPVAPALPGSAVRRNGLRTLPWRVLALGAAVSIALAVRVLVGPDPWGASNRGYYAWSALLLAFFIAMGIAKRRAGSGTQ